jgi:hypothetical protein
VVAAGVVAWVSLSACGTGTGSGTSSVGGSVPGTRQSAASGQVSPEPSVTLPPVTVAPAVAPPAGSQVQDVLQGKGMLVYRCSAGRYALVKTSVQLFVEHGGFAGTQSGLLTWRFKNGTRVDAVITTEVRRPGGLSQALMKVAKVTDGDANDRATTFIVRLPDPGGVPTGTCGTGGGTVSVPVQTRYIFYRSTPLGSPTSAGVTG